jgi:hypothetical protein
MLMAVALRHGSTLELFGRHEPEGAHDCASSGRLEIVPYGAEVDEHITGARFVLAVTCGSADHIARLDIAVDDGRSASMQVVKDLARIL